MKIGYCGSQIRARSHVLVLLHFPSLITRRSLNSVDAHSLGVLPARRNGTSGEIIAEHLNNSDKLASKVIAIASDDIIYLENLSLVFVSKGENGRVVAMLEP